jgi:GH24 family phage-related lysozyme (muramidase)
MNNFIAIFMLCFMVALGIFIYHDDSKIKEEIEAKQISYFEIAVWELIRREDIVLTPYKCPAGHLTVGIGHRTESGDTLCLNEARDQLYTDLQDRYDVFEKYLPNHSRNEIMAVALLAHNIGISKLLSSPQWERIKNKTSDCTYYWSKYVYYTRPDGTPMISENLKQSRMLEIELWEDRESLWDKREYLKEIASNKYVKLAN